MDDAMLTESVAAREHSSGVDIHGLSRRQVMKAGAWATPAIILATAVPAAAASTAPAQSVPQPVAQKVPVPLVLTDLSAVPESSSGFRGLTVFFDDGHPDKHVDMEARLAGQVHPDAHHVALYSPGGLIPGGPLTAVVSPSGLLAVGGHDDHHPLAVDEHGDKFHFQLRADPRRPNMYGTGAVTFFDQNGHALGPVPVMHARARLDVDGNFNPHDHLAPRQPLTLSGRIKVDSHLGPIPSTDSVRLHITGTNIQQYLGQARGTGPWTVQSQSPDEVILEAHGLSAGDNPYSVEFSGGTATTNGEVRFHIFVEGDTAMMEPGKMAHGGHEVTVKFGH